MTAPSIAEIQRAVAEAFGVPLIYLIGDRLDAKAVLPRRVAMYLAREVTGKTAKVIGRAFNRDHTTVLDGVRAIEERAPHDADLGNRIVELRERLTRQSAA